MPFVPSFVTSLAERTVSPDSLLGSIAASLNLPVEDGAAALVWTNRNAIAGQLVSKWPTLQFHIRRAGHLTDRIAEAARNVMVTVDDSFPVEPPNTVLARAVMLLATEKSIGLALELLTVYHELHNDGYPQDREARITALEPYWPGITPAVTGELEDFPRVEAALGRLISMDRTAFRAELGLGKSTVRDLVSGKMEWGERSQIWLLQRVEERATELRRFLSMDKAFVAEARPSLVGLAWQLWPEMQDWIEKHARWINLTPDGDPRMSWKDGWLGYDPRLNPRPSQINTDSEPTLAASSALS